VPLFYYWFTNDIFVLANNSSSFTSVVSHK
jgi:hypothetical protein